MFKYNFKTKLLVKIFLKIFEISFLIAIYLLNIKNMETVENFSDYNFSFNFIRTVSLISLIKNLIILNFVVQSLNFIFITIYKVIFFKMNRNLNKFSPYYFSYLFFSDYLFIIFLFISIIRSYIFYIQNSVEYKTYCGTDCKFNNEYIVSKEKIFITNIILCSVVVLFKLFDLIGEIVELFYTKNVSDMQIKKLGELEL